MEHKETPLQVIKSFSFGEWVATFFTCYGIISFVIDSASLIIS